MNTHIWYESWAAEHLGNWEAKLSVKNPALKRTHHHLDTHLTIIVLLLLFSLLTWAICDSTSEGRDDAYQQVEEVYRAGFEHCQEGYAVWVTEDELWVISTFVFPATAMVAGWSLQMCLLSKVNYISRPPFCHFSKKTDKQPKGSQAKKNYFVAIM